MVFDQGAAAIEEDAYDYVPSSSKRGGTKSRACLPKLVSLFCGAGGLDLGFHQVGYTVAVAIDSARAAIESFKHNFPRSLAVQSDLTKLKPAGVLEIVRSKIALGSKIAVIGGPPCQGFSRANNNSLIDDPRNQLPSLYVRIVRELQLEYEVEFLVMENVPGLKDQKHKSTYAQLIKSITNLGFDLHEQIVCAIDHGVPQNRKRVILIGLRADRGYGNIKLRKRKGPATVREAIELLEEPTYFEHGLDPSTFLVHPNHWTMKPRSERFNGRLTASKTRRSFKVLDWNAASPTIAFGNREIHVHPGRHRRLSIYEAMLLQGFPEEFVLKGNLSEQVLQISNAVPPPLARSVALAVNRAMDWK